MFGRFVLMLLALIGLVTSATAKENRRMITPSGAAEMYFAGQSAGQTLALLDGVCRRIGWTPQKPSGNKMSCKVPTNERVQQLGPLNGRVGSSQGSLASAGSGPGLSGDNLAAARSSSVTVPVQKMVDFEAVMVNGGALATARARRIIPNVTGRLPTDKPILDDQTFYGLVNIMALAGGKFAPGTQFGDFGYLGFRSDRFSEIESDKGKRVAIQVGVVEAKSPAEAAGMREGDLVRSMNGQDFKDYPAVSKFLSKVKPGDQIVAQVERKGAIIPMTIVATKAPPVPN